MRPIAWVSATTFGLVGYVIAAFIAVPFFGWHWVFLPAAVASGGAVYGTSTWLGTLAARRSHGLFLSILVGVGVALATLVAGVVAFGLANFMLALLDDFTSADFGFGGYYSPWKAFGDLVLNPLFAVVPYLGGWIAVALGVAYGLQLHVKTKRAHFV
jgi:hypothetical protein